MIDRILTIIDSSGMSDSAICKELSIGNGIIGKWRKGLQKPSTEAIVKIAQYFHVTTDYLLLGSETNRFNTLSLEDSEFLSLFHQLPREDQIEFLGELKGYIKCLNKESVATDKSLGKTGTTNSVK